MFEIEQLTGKGIDRLLTYLDSRKIEERLSGALSVPVAPELKRLGLMASLAAGRELRVVTLRGDVSPRPYLPVLRKTYHPALLPQHGFPWTDGKTIYLPDEIAGMPSDDLQKYLLKLTVFFLSTQAAEGSVMQNDEFSTDRALADLYWITENARLYALLADEFPALFGKKWDELSAHLVAQRPGRDVLKPGEAAVEAYLKETLLSLALGRMPALSPDDSLKTALSIKRRMENSGIAFKGYRAVVPFEPWGRLIVDTAGTAASTARDGGGAANESPAKKEKDAPRYAAKRRELEKREDSAWMLNIYDKILSWAGFANVNRPFDDEQDDEASKKADEMDEITVASVDASTSARFDAELERPERADSIDLDGGVARPRMYPEWDYRKNKYRPDYVTLVEEDASTDAGGRAMDDRPTDKRLVKEIKRRFEALRPQPALMKRLFDGEYIDVDSLVEAAADLAAGRQPDERFYASYARAERDISTLFLLDLSMSTDAWVGEKRVIEHEKDAMLLFCEAMSKLGDRFAVHGFSGQTRSGARFFRIKNFDEPYGEKAKARMKGLIPYHYTRMGPAIRHAAKLLRAEPSRIKLLFIISDGKPNDVDIYEGRYGVEDTRMAVREAERLGITPFCFTLDLKAKEYLPRVFGRGNYAVASGADKLATTLPALYGRIVRGC